ncbi:MAG: chain-length determining protein [Gammaproteobacteria bacterium]|nr:chain-length determining protein [Gammaproteobacteria bacterium]
MQESIALIINQLRMVWRFRWVGLVVATCVCLIGWLFVFTLPNQYDVSTKVFLDTRSLLRPLLKGLAFDTSVQSSTRIISRTLLARPNLEQIARKTDMDLQAKTPEAFEIMLTELSKEIRVAGTERDNIFVISYANPDAKLATRVVEAVLNLFVEKSLGDSRRDTTKSARFLDQQIKEYESRLVAAESRLKEFKQKNMGLLPGTSGGHFESMAGAAERRKGAELQLREARLRRDELESQLEDVDELLDVENQESFIEDTILTHPMDPRISNLEIRLDELLVKYTDLHPDVISTRAALDRLIEQRAADVADMPAQEGGGMTAGPQQVENPMFQQLQISLSEAEAVVASLEARVEEYRSRETDLGGKVEMALNVEAEFARLNRDYELDRKNYSQLLERREQLSLSEEVSQTTDDVTFNIIEPPREPHAPNSPNRPLLNAGVLGGGVLTGLAIAWLMGMLRPTFYRKEDVASISNLPVLGIVTRIWTPREQFRRRLEITSFGFGCLGLLAMFAVLMVTQALGLDVTAKVQALTQRFL